MMEVSRVGKVVSDLELTQFYSTAKYHGMF